MPFLLSGCNTGYYLLDMDIITILCVNLLSQSVSWLNVYLCRILHTSLSCLLWYKENIPWILHALDSITVILTYIWQRKIVLGYFEWSIDNIVLEVTLWTVLLLCLFLMQSLSPWSRTFWISFHILCIPGPNIQFRNYFTLYRLASVQTGSWFSLESMISSWSSLRRLWASNWL